MNGLETNALSREEFHIQLINEYNLIQRKQSKLSASRRKMVRHLVDGLVNRGKLNKLPNGDVSLSIPIE